ncbi:MAG: hypothetical protein JWN15_2296, partial [Firmicutes bacterium]|nr:hypothetical protein [Bacillota bacterium]
MSTQLSALDRRVTDLCLEFQGSHRFEHSVFVPTAANLASLAQRAEALQAEVAAAAADVDPIWRDHLLEILDVLTFRLAE